MSPIGLPRITRDGATLVSAGYGIVDIEQGPEDMLLTEGDFLALVSRQKGLNFPPGTKHLYSNTGYVLLSLIVRKVSGLSLREFATKEFQDALHGDRNAGRVAI